MTSRLISRGTSTLGAMLLGASLAGCGTMPTGPSLTDLAIVSPTLRATGSNSSLCCCHIVSTVTNRNRVAVHVTLTFSAFNALQREPITNVVWSVDDLQPNQSSPIDAPGLLVPCEAVGRVSYEVTVRGLSSPSL